MKTVMDEARLKQLVKEALIDILDERREYLSELLVEAIEDVAMVRAIQEEEHTPEVARDDILRRLDDVS
ncbi:MAG TPA: hypothetical protein PKI11_13855 [Candidatus Hydrogenedentes bacterium]|nr:hypothetical protein [Candidatus Hydrogenedentota bacterium]HNT89773.1 hypothetical protein [Candidatus Hydrogenedentota bacterium]